MNLQKIFWISAILEVLGITIVAIGVGLELTYKADMYYLVISMGSIMITAGSILFAKFKPWLEEEQ